MRSLLFLKKDLPSLRVTRPHRETIAWKAEKKRKNERERERSLCLNLANCRNARTNYHPTSQQSVPFLLVSALSRLLPLLYPKWVPPSVFDLSRSRRSMSPRESMHRHSRAFPALPFLHGPFDDPGEIPPMVVRTKWLVHFRLFKRIQDLGDSSMLIPNVIVA